ncbi:MAG: TnpV protein [Oscillospiraceae bacterium]|nr:TnpV protein [Oscillospiraceae bacterium]
MKEHYINEKTGISYTLWGDYYLPDLLPAEEEFEIGIWGQRYLHFIKKHRKAFYTNLLTTGVLNKHLAEVDTRAQTMLNDLIKKFAEQEGVNEVLKEQNQMEWVGKMNNIRNRAEEIVYNEVLFK